MNFSAIQTRRSPAAVRPARVTEVTYRGKTRFHIGPLPSQRATWAKPRIDWLRVIFWSVILFGPVVGLLLMLLAVLP